MTNDEEPIEEGKSLTEMARKVMLATIGAVALAQEEAEAFIKKLIDRGEIADKLHADAAACSQLEYVRVPTGFCRKITVTAEDIERVGL